MGKIGLPEIFVKNLGLGRLGIEARGGAWRVKTGERAHGIKGRVWICRDDDRARIAAEALRNVLRAVDVKDQRGAEELARETFEAIGVAVADPGRIEAIARREVDKIEKEFERMKAAGELRDVNRSYKAYRQAETAAGRKAMGYSTFIGTYLEGVVKSAAAHTRITFEEFVG